MVPGVVGAVSPAGVDGGVVPVCGMAREVECWAGCGAMRGDGFVVDAVLSDVNAFGVGGTMGMNALLCGAEGAGAQMCEEDPSVDIDAATVGLEQGVAGAGTGGGEFLVMWSCSRTYCTVAKGMSDPIAMPTAWSMACWLRGSIYARGGGVLDEEAGCGGGAGVGASKLNDWP